MPRKFDQGRNQRPGGPRHSATRLTDYDLLRVIVKRQIQNIPGLGQGAFVRAVEKPRSGSAMGGLEENINIWEKTVLREGDWLMVQPLVES